MIKYALPVAVLYFAVATTAVALPGSTVPQLTSPSDIVQVSSKGKGKGHGKSHKDHGKSHKDHGKSHKGHSHHNHNHHHHYGDYHKYHYHGRYWGHRYSYRPYNWQTLGCIAAGPIWYCP
jgi:ABC-type Zn2+ transport system substrate-binding protein/surface adhesin